jgi:hypothetical protein
MTAYVCYACLECADLISIWLKYRLACEGVHASSDVVAGKTTRLLGDWFYRRRLKEKKQATADAAGDAPPAQRATGQAAQGSREPTLTEMVQRIGDQDANMEVASQQGQAGQDGAATDAEQPGDTQQPAAGDPPYELREDGRKVYHGEEPSALLWALIAQCGNVPCHTMPLCVMLSDMLAPTCIWSVQPAACSHTYVCSPPALTHFHVPTSGPRLMP